MTNGKLTVVVTLDEARWMKVSAEDDGSEIWQAEERVEGLPSEASVTLELNPTG